MAKTANLYARIEPEVKEEAENILTALGIPVSNAISMFYKQIILQRGIPFDIKLPANYPINASKISEDELHHELEKGYIDVIEGYTKPVGAVFEEIGRDYNV